MSDSFFDEVRISPRVRGVREHYARAVWFLNLCKDSIDMTAKFRLAFAGIYSARAVVELMLETAFDQEIPKYNRSDPKDSRKEFENTILKDIKFYTLIEKLRIHDFHRFGYLPPRPNVSEVFFGGTAKLIANKGVAMIGVMQGVPQKVATGNSKIIEQRTLYQENGRYFDESSGHYYDLEEILAQFIAEVAPVISQFESELPGYSD